MIILKVTTLAMKIKVNSNELYEQIKGDIVRLLSYYMGNTVDSVIITDIQSKVFAYIQELPAEELNRLFVLKASVTDGSMIEVHFEPTEEFYMRIIKDYHEKRD